MNSWQTGIGGFIQERTPLWRMRRALERGKITLGFLGGSITENIEAPWEGRRWSDKVVNWFVGAFPGLIVNVENAAKGATGSLSALFRVQEDIIQRHCDLVFVEYAVNDGGPDLERSLCREGLMRKLLNAPERTYDLCVVYTFCPAMLPDMLAGHQPDSVAHFEILCRHYGLSSVEMGAFALREMNAGRLRWPEWLPDGLHTGDMGSYVYAQPVTHYLARQAECAEITEGSVPAPLFPGNWERAEVLDLDIPERIGPWRLCRNRRIPTAERMLTTAALGAKLRFRFIGTGLLLCRRVSTFSADWRVRIDGGDWIVRSLEHANWEMQCSDFIREELVVTGLSPKEHEAELEPIRDLKNACRGTDFELCTLGIIQ